LGVAYGSPTRKVSELLQQAAEENVSVLRHPPPFVWFVEFGDNALNFELYFWVEVRNVAERKRIESEIRFQVDHLFREAEIVIAFPQRDVHIDTQSPVEIRLVADPKHESPRATGTAGAPVSDAISDSLGGWIGTGQTTAEPPS
jgi:small-conductance mechanosensitive channel